MVDDAADTKRRDDASDARRARREPAATNHAPAISPRHPGRRRGRAVVPVEAEQVQRRGKDLHGGGGEELRGGEPGDTHALGRVGVEVRREARGRVEGRKDGQAVAQRKDGDAGERDGARGGRAGCAEELDKGLVFVHAERDVGEGRGGELGGARGGGAGGRGRDRRGGRVERVGRQVGAAVEEEDEPDGLGGEGAEGMA